MTSNKDNLTFEKTSFLHGNNSPFIKELYLKYLKNPKSIPESWIEFFDGLDEDQETIKKEILGPSWAPKKKINLEISDVKKNIDEFTFTLSEFWSSIPNYFISSSIKETGKEEILQHIIEINKSL